MAAAAAISEAFSRGNAGSISESDSGVVLDTSIGGRWAGTEQQWCGYQKSSRIAVPKSYFGRRGPFIHCSFSGFALGVPSRANCLSALVGLYQAQGGVWQGPVEVKASQGPAR